jgi:RimJ/RimL family protein N-acetyltransferase
MEAFRIPLEGTLIRLRPLVEADRDALFAAASDPLIWEQHPQNDRYQRPVFDTFFDALLGFTGPYIVLDRMSGQVIGTSSFFEFRPEDSSVSIGYTFIGRAYWGHTFNREMKQLMIGHALTQVRTVYFHIGAGNLRSQAAIRKIGAIECGEEIRYTPNGTAVRTLIFKVVAIPPT